MGGRHRRKAAVVEERQSAGRGDPYPATFILGERLNRIVWKFRVRSPSIDRDEAVTPSVKAVVAADPDAAVTRGDDRHRVGGSEGTAGQRHWYDPQLTKGIQAVGRGDPHRPFAVLEERVHLIP